MNSLSSKNDTTKIKLVDYSDTDCSSFAEEEACVGNRGKKKQKRSSKKRSLEKCVGSNKFIKPNPCRGGNCGNACADYSETERDLIFEYYWGLASDEKQKAWLMSCIDSTGIKRKRGVSLKRKQSYNYFIKCQGEKLKVCQKFLLKTLDISQMTLRRLVKGYFKNTKKKYSPHNKTSQEKIDIAHSFIKKLPAVPAHYCRNKSQKLYLPQELRNIPTVYKCYNEHLQHNNQEAQLISLAVFRKIFKKDFHLGFHLPKSDKCILCEKFKHMSKDQQSEIEQTEAYKNHVLDKDKCKQLFLQDQIKSKQMNSKFLCASFDLQKVLYTPHSSSVNLYYSRKYHYFNESVYESGTKNGYCFLWGETDGKRGCNEICSIIYLYLTELDKKESHDTVSLFCDSCAGQNRNRAFISMIAFFLKRSTYITSIKVTFLLPGHTMMPVDSIHSTIESFIKKRTIWSPLEWPVLIQNSRINPRNYEIRCLQFSEFRDWKSFSEEFLPSKYKIKFNSLRSVQLDKANSYIKLHYGYFENSEIQTINTSTLCLKKKRCSNIIETGPKQLYREKLKIAEAKYKDLYKLCEKGIIPKRYHNEYMQMNSSKNVEDTLAETDNDDESVLSD